MTDDDDLLAAEIALGLLEPAEVRGLDEQLGDPQFTARVEWWQHRLAGLAPAAVAAEMPELWARIERHLPANDNAVLRRWQGLSAVLGAVAAALLVVLVLRAPTQIPPPVVASGPQLAAALSGEGGTAVAITFDSVSRRLIVAPVKLDAGAGDAELWVIPRGATVPVSIGVIAAKAVQAHQLDPRQAALLSEGANFAISREPRGGSPTGKPTGEIVASGAIATT